MSNSRQRLSDFPVPSGPSRSSRKQLCLMLNDSGTAAVEFAFIMPTLLFLYFGGIELWTGTQASQQLDVVTHTLGDLVGQSLPIGGNGPQITDEGVQQVFSAAAALMEPFSARSLNVTISEILISNDHSGNPQATLNWSVASGTSPKLYSCPSIALRPSSLKSAPPLPTGFPTVPQSFMAGAGVQLGAIIVTEVSYTYAPAIHFIGGLLGGSGVTFNRVSFTQVRNTYNNTAYPILRNHIVDKMTSATANSANCLTAYGQ